MPLDATVGGSSANSYVTLADADEYMSSRFGTANWDALADSDREKALIQATRHIDSLRLKGYKNSSSQALEFPRTRQLQPVTELPPEVVQACCEEALWIADHSATGGRSPRQRFQAEGVSSHRIGMESETFSRGSREPLGPEAKQLLIRWIQSGAPIIVGRQRAASGRRWWPFE